MCLVKDTMTNFLAWKINSAVESKRMWRPWACDAFEVVLHAMAMKECLPQQKTRWHP